MLPANIAGILILLAAFAPGYAWIKIAETRILRPQRSALLETVELGLVGASATLIATAVVALVDSVLGLGMADLGRWTSEGSDYFEDNPTRILATVAAISVISLLGTWGAARIAYRQYPPIFGPERSVWTDVLARSGEAASKALQRSAFLAATLKDGRIIEGFLFSFPAGPTDEVGEVALQAPIFVRQSSTSPRMSLPDIQFLILLLSEVTDIGVRYEDVKVENT